MKESYLGLLIIALMLVGCAPRPMTSPVEEQVVSPLSTLSPLSPLPAEDIHTPVITAAVQALAEKLDVEPGEIVVHKAVPVQWNNSCLGCESPGQVCAMVLTPGMRVTLEYHGQNYEAHTNQDGSHVVFCTGGGVDQPTK